MTLKTKTILLAIAIFFASASTSQAANYYVSGTFSFADIVALSQCYVCLWDWPWGVCQ